MILLLKNTKFIDNTQICATSQVMMGGVPLIVTTEAMARAKVEGREDSFII